MSCPDDNISSTSPHPLGHAFFQPLFVIFPEQYSEWGRADVDSYLGLSAQ